MVAIEKTDSESVEAVALIDALNRYLWGLYPEEQAEYDQHNGLPPDVTFVVARIDGKAVGCGAFRPISSTPDAVEIKRMYVAPSARGHGLGKAILADLEGRASADGYAIARLETGKKQAEAIVLYERLGYRRIPNYPPYVDNDNSLCYEKQLA